MPDYAERLATAGEPARQVDTLLREFADLEYLKVELSQASLKVRGADRRAVVFQPRPEGNKPPGLRVQFHAVKDEGEIRIVSEGLRAVGGRVERTFSFVPLRALLERWDEVKRLVLDPFFGLSPRQRALKVGDRVRLRRTLERYPDALVEAGAVGTVIDSEDVVIRLDDPVEGLEDWDNQLHGSDESPLEADLELLSESGEQPSVGSLIQIRAPNRTQPRPHRVEAVFPDHVVLLEMWRKDGRWIEAPAGPFPSPTPLGTFKLIEAVAPRGGDIVDDGG